MVEPESFNFFDPNSTEVIKRLYTLSEDDERTVLQQLAAVHNQIVTILRVRLMDPQHNDGQHIPLETAILLMNKDALYFIDTALSLTREYLEMTTDDDSEDDSE